MRLSSSVAGGSSFGGPARGLLALVAITDVFPEIIAVGAEILSKNYGEEVVDQEKNEEK